MTVPPISAFSQGTWQAISYFTNILSVVNVANAAEYLIDYESNLVLSEALSGAIQGIVGFNGVPYTL